MGLYPARVHPFEVEMARGMVLEALNCRNTLPDSSHKIGEKVQVKISHLKRNRNIMKICTCCTISKYYMGTPRVSTLQVRSGTIWRTSIYINLIQFTSHWVQQRVFLFSRSSNTERNFTPASQQFHWHICNTSLHSNHLKPTHRAPKFARQFANPRRLPRKFWAGNCFARTSLHAISFSMCRIAF